VRPLATVLRFFTQFADPTKSSYSWNDFNGKADDQFVAEKLAMYIGYSSEFQTLKARNPKANFEMSFLPQTRGYNTFATAGEVVGIATLKTTKNLLASLTAESQFASAGISPSIATSYGAVPALRSYATIPGVPEVVARSMLVAQTWYDSFPAQSTALIGSMIADVVNGRLGPNDAADSFVARLQGLYTPH
jgi:ABC-type glycerol-3-phosphate transport system substrate-binding protein